MVQVVLGPHVYGPSVTGVTSKITGKELWDRLNDSFGRKALNGYCFENVCNRFAVVLGEYGSSFTQNAGDVALHNDLALWLNYQGAAAYGHTKVVSWGLESVQCRHWWYGGQE